MGAVLHLAFIVIPTVGRNLRIGEPRGPQILRRFAHRNDRMSHPRDLRQLT